MSSEAIIDIAPKTECYVLDGGSLLHRLPWKLGDSYGAIAQSYVDFTNRHYGLAIVVFDGYGGGPSIKDNTHQRHGHNILPVVKFTEETEFSGKKGDFLSRDSNKQGLINLISDGLRKRGCNVINASGDADVDIVKAAVESSHLHSTTLIGEDTDLFVLILYHAHAEYKNLYFRSDTKAKATKVYNINRLKVILGNDLCSQLLFIHAITGCDTTSRIFGVGKKATFQKLVKGDSVLQSCSNEFISPNQTSYHLRHWQQSNGCLVWWKVHRITSILTLQHIGKESFLSEIICYTRTSAPYCILHQIHCLRAYYQIMAWTEQEGDMDVTNWGWKLKENSLIPIMSEMNAAPDILLKMIHCNCTTACTTLRCSCRRYGLPCHTVCGQCQLDECNNTYNQRTVEENDSE